MKQFSIWVIVIWVFILIVQVACKKEKEISQTPLTPISLDYPKYVPQPNLSPSNPLTAEGVQLGRRLYYDPILSNNGQSCSSCHNQKEAFTDSIHNALPHINLAWNKHFLWNGNIEGTLEDAMMFEVKEFFSTDIGKINQDATYKTLFKNVFNIDVIDEENISKALAQFMATQTSFNSKFDKYLRKEVMLSDEELKGFYIFNSEKGDCFHCHSLGLFTDGQFRNNGLASTFAGYEQGRFNATNNVNDIGKFKTPTLRNIAWTAPYMHDGRYKTLEEVVEFYNSHVKQSATLDPIMTKPSFENGLELTSDDKKNLIAFLKSLSDSAFIENPLLSKP